MDMVNWSLTCPIAWQPFKRYESNFQSIIFWELFTVGWMTATTVMMIMAHNEDDSAVLRSNNWLAWLTVTSRAGWGEGGRRSSLWTSTKTLQKPPLIRSWINIEPGWASTQKWPKLFKIPNNSHKHPQIPIETFKYSRKPTTAKKTLTNQNLRSGHNHNQVLPNHPHITKYWQCIAL